MSEKNQVNFRNSFRLLFFWFNKIRRRKFYNNIVKEKERYKKKDCERERKREAQLKL
jgi:hypothetical protein